MAKKNYDALIHQIVDLVGGKENVQDVLHCITRLRFNVKDKSKVQTEAIGKLEGVLGTNWVGNQLQIIIGQNVNDVYTAICKQHGLDAQASVDENLDASSQKLTLRAIPGICVDYISGSIQPLLPALIGAGFIKIIVLIGEMMGLLTAGSSTHTILTFAGDAAFYFLPVMVGVYAAKKLGANPGLGMLMGAILIHPDFVTAVGTGDPLTLFALPVQSLTYSSSVFPILLTVAVMAPIEKFFAKHSPEMLRSITEPLGTILITLPLSLCLLAPLGNTIGNGLSAILLGFYEMTGFLGVALITALMPLLIMTGMHVSLVPYALDCFATLGYEPFFFLAMTISNINQGAACTAVAIKTKDKALRSTAFSCAVTAFTSGVIEPGLYGVSLKYRTPLYGIMIGSFVGGGLASLLGAAAYSNSGSFGLISLPIYFNGTVSSIIAILAGVIVGIAVTFLSTMVLYKPEK